MAKKAKKSAKVGRSLAAMVRASREAAGLSQNAAATAAGISLSSLVKIEAGAVPDPRWATMVRLAKIYNADLTEWAEAEEQSAE